MQLRATTFVRALTHAECVHCGVLMCVLQSDRDRRDVEVEPHVLIFSPPYESEAQAIEKVWAKVKQFVAKKDHIKRTPTEVRQHIARVLRLQRL